MLLASRAEELADAITRLGRTLSTLEDLNRRLQQTDQVTAKARDQLLAQYREADAEFDARGQEAEALAAQYETSVRASSDRDEFALAEAKRARAALQKMVDQKAKLDLLQGARGGADSPQRSYEREEARYDAEFNHLTSRLESSSERLLESRKTLLETESVAVGIGEDLLEQRGTIASARAKLQQTGGLMGAANRAMRGVEMARKQKTLVAYSGVCIVVFAILIVLARALLPASKPKPPTLAPTPKPTSAFPTLSPTLEPTMDPTPPPT